MKFDEYQLLATRYDHYTESDDLRSVAMMDKVLGLAGETGEVVEKIKKLLRDQDGNVSLEDQDAIAKELGDVLWYLSEIARYLHIPLSYVARHNLDKLESRLKRGTLSGSGDDR